MLGSLLSLIAGPIIYIIVGFLKRIPIVAANPKLAATVLAAIASVLMVLPGTHGIADIIKQIADQIGTLVATAAAVAATAIGTHEVVGNAVRTVGIDPTVPTASTPSPLQGK